MRCAACSCTSRLHPKTHTVSAGVLLCWCCVQPCCCCAACAVLLVLLPCCVLWLLGWAARAVASTCCARLCDCAPWPCLLPPAPGWNALHYAVAARQEQLVEQLLKRGADANAPEGSLGLRPLHLACLPQLTGADMLDDLATIDSLDSLMVRVRIARPEPLVVLWLCWCMRPSL